MYANILIVDKPGNYERVFTYSIPAGMKVGSGDMVLVPVRRQYCQGLVLSLQEKPDLSMTRSARNQGDQAGI